MSKFTFISIPRTASNSIHQALGTGKSDNHKSIAGMKVTGFCFAVIRHPLDRLVSWWSFHKAHEPNLKMYQCTFAEWFNSGCPHHWSKGVLRQSRVTNPLNQYEFVDYRVFLIRFEKLQKYWDYIQIVTDNKSVLPALYPSDRGHWSKYFTPVMMEEGMRIFEKDFNLWENIID